MKLRHIRRRRRLHALVVSVDWRPDWPAGRHWCEFEVVRRVRRMSRPF